MLHGVADAARAALEADAIVIYTLGADGPVALEAVGTGLPETCDGVAAQAIATARSVVDADGRFLASSPRRAGLRRRRAAPRRRRARRHLGAVPRRSGRSPTATREDLGGLRADRRPRHRPRDAGAGARPARGAARRLPRDHRGARRHPRAGRDLHGRGLGRPPRPARRRRGRRDGVGRTRPAGHGLRTDHAGAGRRVGPGRRAAAAGSPRGPHRALRRRLVRPPRARAPSAAGCSTPASSSALCMPVVSPAGLDRRARRGVARGARRERRRPRPRAAPRHRRRRRHRARRDARVRAPGAGPCPGAAAHRRPDGLQPRRRRPCCARSSRRRRCC